MIRFTFSSEMPVNKVIEFAKTQTQKNELLDLNSFEIFKVENNSSSTLGASFKTIKKDV